MVLLGQISIDFCGAGENKAVVVTVIYFFKVVKCNLKTTDCITMMLRTRSGYCGPKC